MNGIPYPLLNKNEIQTKINELASNDQPFIFIINYKADSGYVIPDNVIKDDYIRTSFAKKNELLSKSKNPDWKVKAIDFEIYKSKFDYIKSEIQKGNSFLVNFTQPSEIDTNLTLDTIFDNSNAPYKLWVKNKFVVMSPETFITIDKVGVIRSNPMKGTIDANLPFADEIILNDLKEKAEHATIVDLIRNDLSMVATNVEVSRYRYIDRIETNKGALLQVSSEISGQLAQNYKEKLGNIIMQLLPAGSISGAPKPKTMEIIKHAEQYDRGFYTGIFGKFDGQQLNSAVMIRFVEKINNKLYFKSGGGITAKSNCLSEYNELIQKVYVPFY